MAQARQQWRCQLTEVPQVCQLPLSMSNWATPWPRSGMALMPNPPAVHIQALATSLPLSTDHPSLPCSLAPPLPSAIVLHLWSIGETLHYARPWMNSALAPSIWGSYSPRSDAEPATQPPSTCRLPGLLASKPFREVISPCQKVRGCLKFNGSKPGSSSLLQCAQCMLAKTRLLG